VGVERWSTNLVCERAGLTPPALYRYFPNKYALLHELGERLMAVQNQLLEAWATAETMALPRARFEASVLALFAQTVEVTEAAPAGVWITRALRAVPALQAARADVRVFARLAIESAYATQEMLFDDPDLDPMAVGRVLASMLAGEAIRLRRPGRSASR
jgi:AcrR family transcriptional regulator